MEAAKLEQTRRRIIAVSASVLLVGVLAFAALVVTRPVAPKHNRVPAALTVLTTRIDARSENTPIVGHGTVRAKHQVNIIPEVSGKLTYVHENLQQGKVLKKGDLLFEINPVVYQARVRQSEAEIQRLEAVQLSRDQELASLNERISNSKEMLAIAQADYETSRRLYEEENVGTQRDLGVVHQKYLGYKDTLVELDARRVMIPFLKQETMAQLEAARSRYTQASHNLENTKIFCPFDARVERVSAYRAQVVTAHFSVATLTDMEALEIPVSIDLRDLRWLHPSIRPEALENEERMDSPEVRVHWSLHREAYSWPGRVSRFERVDETTRLARMVVEVRGVDITAQVEIGTANGRPSLSIGMFCRAELPALELHHALIVPRHTLMDDKWVYVFEPDTDSPDCTTGRLGRREVPVLRSMGDDVLVDYEGRVGTELCELREGEQVIVSPLLKPVVGMSIRLRDREVAVAAAEPVQTDTSSSTSRSDLALTLAQASLLGGGD